jgi:hypothetical protein
MPGQDSEGGKAMRILLFIAAALAATVANAETSFFWAERGHWFVGAFGKSCRALNRPPIEFNDSPYNGLEIVVRAGGTISADVFFWPGEFDSNSNYVLKLNFTGRETLSLPAKSIIGQYMLASDPDPKLWRNFQDATGVTATVEGKANLRLYFGLDDMMWVLNRLQSCSGTLPKD